MTQVIPEVGQAVRVRNRLATVQAVEPYDLHGIPCRESHVVKQKVDPQNKREIDGLNEYLKSVGRGLPYNLLHEFWHAAQRTGEHPFELGNVHIEGGLSPTKPNLVFQKDAIGAMLADYEKTWCTYINEARIGVGDLKP